MRHVHCFLKICSVCCCKYESKKEMNLQKSSSHQFFPSRFKILERVCVCILFSVFARANQCEIYKYVNHIIYNNAKTTNTILQCKCIFVQKCHFLFPCNNTYPKVISLDGESGIRRGIDTSGRIPCRGLTDGCKVWVCHRLLGRQTFLMIIS